MPCATFWFISGTRIIIQPSFAFPFMTLGLAPMCMNIKRKLFPSPSFFFSPTNEGKLENVLSDAFRLGGGYHFSADAASAWQ